MGPTENPGEVTAQLATLSGSTPVAEGTLPVWLDFISSIVSSLAWPLLLLAVIIIFKSTLTKALLNLKSLKYGDAEARFADDLKEVSETAKAIEPVAPDLAEANKARLVQLVDMAAASPSGAIVEAWKDVEQAVRTFAEDRGLLEAEVRNNFLGIEKFLRNNELLPSAELHTLRELRTLRNRAAHENDHITVEQAREYVRIADRLVDSIASMSQNFGAPT